MNGAVHYGLTRRWALEEGFTAEEAEVIARADIGVDRDHPGHEWRNWGWHFMLAGAALRVLRLEREAAENGDLNRLGEALHCAQDSIGHGLLGHLVHWDGIDIWERRSQRVRDRIERRSRLILAEHRSKRLRQTVRDDAC